MKQEIFNINTEFKNNTCYVFDKKDTDIYLSQTTPAIKKKYLTICGGTENKEKLDTAFYLCGLENVILDFDGAVITLHGKIQPILLDSCSNVRIKNVTIEYERAMYTELDIIENSEGELRTKPKEKFPCRIENGYFIPYAKEWEDRSIHANGCIFMQAYDKETRDGAGLKVIYLGEEIIEQESPPIDNIDHIRARSEGDEIIFIGDFPQNWDSSKSIAIEHDRRDKTSAAVYHSKNIGFENYRILNGAGMGFYIVYTENITLRAVKLINDELSHGIIANAADGAHFVACKGKIEIADSIFEGTIDDALNVHSNYYHTEKAERNMICARRSDKSHGLSAYTEVFGIGDVIAVYNGRTMEEKARFTIKDVKITGEWTLELAVDKPTDNLRKEDLIENISANPELAFKNTRFAKSNSNLRLQTRGRSVIENCEFTLPILLTGDTNYWFEASPINDLTIDNCKFIGEKAVIRIVPEFTATKAAPFYHSGIKITNNTFDSSIPLYAYNAKDISFTGNIISGSKEQSLELHDCQNVMESRA